ncbi:MAG: hypothetical protein IJ154_04940 [Bacteroidales bacterium]|nr:hypothetical protein [Bacteroidales bacterium]
MKKALLVLVAVFGLTAVMMAQPRAIGLRIGPSTEVSYQHMMGENFLEVDGGIFFNHGFYATGIYNFIFASEGDFNFYAGPGATVGFYNYKDDADQTQSGLDLGIAGMLGMEYNFQIPLTLSLDWRPTFYFLDGGFAASSFALGVRYRF